MIYLITAPRDRGKTSATVSLYGSIGSGDGIISPKLFLHGSFCGYLVKRLSTGESMSLAAPLEAIPADWDEYARHGSFTFSRRGMAFAGDALREMVERGISPIFIDEVGPLELRERGFPVRDILRSATGDIYCTLRDRLLASFLDRYGPADYTIITPPAAKHKDPETAYQLPAATVHPEETSHLETEVWNNSPAG